MPPTERLPEKCARCQTRRRRMRRKTTPCLPTRVTVAKSFHHQQLRKAMLTGPVSSAHKDHKEQPFERRSLPWLLAAAWTRPLAVVVVVSFWMAEPACNDDAAAALVDVVVGGGGDQMWAEVPPLLAPLATALQFLGVVVDVVLACNWWKISQRHKSHTKWWAKQQTVFFSFLQLQLQSAKGSYSSNCVNLPEKQQSAPWRKPSRLRTNKRHASSGQQPNPKSTALSKSKATPHSREENKQDDAQKKHREKR